MATKKSVKKAPEKIFENEKKTPELKKVDVKARFKFEFNGKIYAKGETLSLFDGDAKRLVDKGFCEKA